jgi:RNA polymerase sigma-70 factor (ECF subfamily)
VTADSDERAAPPRAPYHDIETLVREMGELLYGVACGILRNIADAEDVVQNTYVKALLNWPRVDSLPTWSDQCAFMVRIVTNEVKQLKRKRYWKAEYLGDNGEEIPRIPDDVDEHLQTKEHLRLLWQAIYTFREERRDVVAVFAAGYEYGEIAEMLGIHVSTVRSHMSNARQYLRREFPGVWEGIPE